jgi:hypothetical protein
MLASAMVGTMRMLGQMFSMGVAALVITLFVGHTTIGAANQDAFIEGGPVLLV